MTHRILPGGAPSAPAATGAPLTGILLVFEVTNDYAIVLPSMITVVVTQLVAKRLEPDNLYSGWLRRRGERIEFGADRDVLYVTDSTHGAILRAEPGVAGLPLDRAAPRNVKASP